MPLWNDWRFLSHKGNFHCHCDNSFLTFIITEKEIWKPIVWGCQTDFNTVVSSLAMC
jgi:hypothetical protein